MRFVLLSLLTIGTLSAQLKEYKPSRFNLFSKDQDVQLGKESADEVRKTMPMVNNKDLVDYMNRIGQRLAASKRVLCQQNSSAKKQPRAASASRRGTDRRSLVSKIWTAMNGTKRNALTRMRIAHPMNKPIRKSIRPAVFFDRTK